MKVCKKLKDKWNESKLKKLEKEAIRLHVKISRLQRQQENLKTGEIPTDSNKRQDTSVMKKELEKSIEKKTGHDEGQESPHTIKSDDMHTGATKQSKDASKENVKKTTRPDTNKRQANKILKRCHFCRKRGHLKKNCPIKQKCWSWMKGGLK